MSGTGDTGEPKVPGLRLNTISTAFFMSVQVAAMVWFAATLTARLKGVEDRIVDMSKIIVTQQDLAFYKYRMDKVEADNAMLRTRVEALERRR